MDDGTMGGTFAEVLSKAMVRRRMSLTHVRDAMTSKGHPLSLATLSYWRNGSRLPARLRSREALPDLEQLLDLPRNTLVNLVPTQNQGSPVKPFSDLIGAPASVELMGEQDIDRVLTHAIIDIDADRKVAKFRAVQGFVARREGVDGVTLFALYTNGTDPTNAQVVPIAGCTVGEMTNAGTGLTATRIFFTRPLHAGESIMTEWEMRLEHPTVETDLDIVAEQRLDEAMVWVRFHPDCIPAKAWVWFEESGLQHEWLVSLEGSDTLHYRQPSFGPGRLGVRWEW